MKIGKVQDFVNAGRCLAPQQAIGADPGRRRLYERPTVSRLKIEQIVQAVSGGGNDGQGTGKDE